MDSGIDGVLSQPWVVNTSGSRAGERHDGLVASGMRRRKDWSAGGPMKPVEKGRQGIADWASRAVVSIREYWFESVSVPSRSNIADLSIIM